MRPKTESARILRWDNLTDGETETLDSLGDITLPEEELRMNVHHLRKMDENRVADLHVQLAPECLVNDNLPRAPGPRNLRDCFAFPKLEESTVYTEDIHL